MSDRAAFIRAILDSPDDDTARLVFADWLEEHGEPERAEFIRAQIAPTCVPETVRRRNDPGERVAGLHGAAIGGGWRRALGLSEVQGEYVRGFLTGVVLPSAQFLERATQVLASEPVAIVLELRNRHNEWPVTRDQFDQLATSPCLRAVSEIVDYDYRIGAEMFCCLMRSPHLVNLRKIQLFECHIGPRGVRAIADAPAAFRLRALVLNESLRPAPLDAVQLIATSPRFASLKYLDLSFNDLGNDSVEALLASQTLPRQMRLELRDNDHDEERYAGALAERFTGGSDEGGDST